MIFYKIKKLTQKLNTFFTKEKALKTLNHAKTQNQFHQQKLQQSLFSLYNLGPE